MKMNPKAVKVSLVLGGTLLLILYLNGSIPFVATFSSDELSVPELKAMLKFVPESRDYICEDLFKGTPAEKYNMTPSFHKYQKDYWDVATRSGRLPEEEYRALHYTAGQKFVKNVCETGFNAGCSSFYSLTASDQTVIHSFELGGSLYREQVAKWLSSIFSSRFSIHLGDSTKTVPEFARRNPDFRCDFMYVDGGHVYPVAKADIINFSNMANLKHNFIAFDDYPPGWENFGQAWEESIADGTIKELARCSFKSFSSPPRGFVIGVVVKHPNGSKN